MGASSSPCGHYHIKIFIVCLSSMMISTYRRITGCDVVIVIIILDPSLHKCFLHLPLLVSSVRFPQCLKPFAKLFLYFSLILSPINTDRSFCPCFPDNLLVIRLISCLYLFIIQSRKSSLISGMSTGVRSISYKRVSTLVRI